MTNTSRRTIAATVLTALLGAATALGGCASTTTRGEQHRALTLYEPADQSLVRGTTNKMLVVVDREQVAGPLAIDLDDLPDGVSVVEESPLIPDDARSATITLHAAADADLVTGHPVRIEVESSDGLEVSEWLEVDVVAGR